MTLCDHAGEGHDVDKVVVRRECSKSEFGGPEKGLGGEENAYFAIQAVDLRGIGEGPP